MNKIKNKINELLPELNLLLDQLTNNYSEPVRKTDQEVEEMIEQLRQSTDPGRTFYIVASTLSVKLPHLVHVDKYLATHKGFNADDYITLIHPNYIDNYLRWAIACYSFLLDRKNEIEVLSMSYRITVPLKFNDDKYYWVFMEVFPLQFDKDGNLLAHLNKYSVLYTFSEDARFSLIDEMSNPHFLNTIWHRDLLKRKNVHAYFMLTSTEQKIIEVHFYNPHFTNRAIALHLKKKKNTLDKHHKNILAKARKSFPGYDPSDIKELVATLIEYGYFEGIQSDSQKESRLSS